MSQRIGFVVLVLGLLATRALAAESGNVEELRESQKHMQHQLELLSTRVAQLEARNHQLEVAARTAKAPTGTAASNGQGNGTNEASAFLGRFTWNADFRLRHDRTEVDGIGSRDRERFQSHFGFEAALTDDVAVGLQLATGGDDPRSANQTLGNEFSRKPVGVDLAYLRWSAADGVAVTGGKMKYPIYRPAGSKLYDSDVSPEGLALRIERSRLFANLYGFSVDERAASADTTLAGAQAGMKLSLGDAGSLTAALGYSDLAAGVGRAPFFAFAANGNTLNPDGTLAFDFRVTQASLEYARPLRALPFVAFVDAARNAGAPDGLDTAYALGFLLGKAGPPGSWETGYLYQRVEKDAWFGQIFDSDFGGGMTDSKGSVFRIAYAPFAKGVFTATYYLNDLAISNPASPDSTDELQRLQLDFTMKF